MPYDSLMNKEKANWLRAAVLGANDGIVSVAGLVIGVASATDDKIIILVAGLAGVFAGALAKWNVVCIQNFRRQPDKALLQIESAKPN